MSKGSCALIFILWMLALPSITSCSQRHDNTGAEAPMRNSKQCPNGEFKTTGTWKGCHCPAGRKKEYLDIFKYKAKCIPIRPTCYHFSSEGLHCQAVVETHYGCASDHREYTWTDGCFGWYETYHLGVERCFDVPLAPTGACREGYSIQKEGHIFR
jgi:hypothetical protein